MLAKMLEAVPQEDRVILITAEGASEPIRSLAESDRAVQIRCVAAEELNPVDRLPLDCHLGVITGTLEQGYLAGELAMNDRVWVIVDSPAMTATFHGKVIDFLLPKLERGTVSSLPGWLAPDLLRDILLIMLQLRAIPKHRRVGSMMIVGRPETVLPLSVQCEYISFDSLGPEHRRIGDAGTQELIRKLAPIDHVYLVDTAGNLVALLEYIFPPGGPRALGLGSRHTSAAALSANCDVVVFTVQGSTGKIRAYCGGEVALQI